MRLEHALWNTNSLVMQGESNCAGGMEKVIKKVIFYGHRSFVLSGSNSPFSEARTESVAVRHSLEFKYSDVHPETMLQGQGEHEATV